MSITRHYLLATLWTGLCLLPSVATATWSININFEGDTSGSQPTVNTMPGDPVTQPYAIGAYNPSDNYESPPTAASGTIVIGNPSGGSKEAVLTTNQNNPSLGALWMDVNGFNLAAQKLHLSFDVNILAAPTTATGQPKILNGGTAGILLGMNTYTASDQGPDWAFRFAAAPTSENGGVFAFRTPDNSELIPFFNYSEGTQYSLAIDADYSTGKLNASVNGVQQLTDYAFWAGGGKTNVITDEIFFHLNGEGNPAFSSSVALDNITAAAVPEPTGFLFGGLVCCVIGLAVGGWQIAEKLRTRNAL